MAKAIKDLAIPTVHLNGTPKAELIEQLCNAYNALQEALKVMRQATPNGRDYYVQADKEALTDALRQHNYRQAKVCEVMDDLEQITIAIDTQN